MRTIDSGHLEDGYGGQEDQKKRFQSDEESPGRAVPSAAIGRKNYLFPGSQTDGRAAAIAYTLIETAKLKGVDPQAWLADALARIPDCKINLADDLLPWKITP